MRDHPARMQPASPPPSPGRQAALDVLLLLAESDARSADYRGALRMLDHAAEAARGLPIEYQLKRERWTKLRDTRGRPRLSVL
jgi:hypothetical protein